MIARNETGISPDLLEEQDSILWDVPIGLDHSQAELICFPIHQSQFLELNGLAEQLGITLAELFQATTVQFLAQGEAA